MFRFLFRRPRTKVGAPVLFIAGAQKCGTSTLWKSLCKHPRIRTAIDPITGKRIKELGLFVGRNHDIEGTTTRQQQTIFSDSFPRGAGPMMDATPEYLCQFKAHKRMARAFPDACLIISLRNPIDRAYSQYNHYMQDLPETKGWDWEAPGDSFTTNLESEFARIHSGPISTYGMVGRGLYAMQIRHLLKYFPRDQVKIVILEQWSRDPRKLHTEILEDLGLGDKMLPIEATHRRQKTVEKMSDATRSLLAEHYRPHNAELEELLGYPIPEWK
jgi:hypothetical protein